MNGSKGGTMKTLTTLFLVICSTGTASAFSDPELDAEYAEELENLVNVPVNPDAVKQDLKEYKSRMEETHVRDSICHNEQNEWKCSKGCNMMFEKNKTTGMCRKPDPMDQCLGVPINYMYVSADGANHSIPDNIASLRLFPGCWHEFAPFFCSRIYRPCAIHSYTEVIESPFMWNLSQTSIPGRRRIEGRMELWMRVRRGMCNKVLFACQSVIDQGFIKREDIDCPDTVGKEEMLTQYVSVADVSNNDSGKDLHLYSKSCEIASGRNFSNKPWTGQCVNPLISSETTQIKTLLVPEPLVDHCFLPCRSSTLPYDVSDFVNTAQLVVTLALAACFAAEAIYLICVAKIHSTSLIVFCIGQALGSAAIYYLIWAVSSVPSVASAAECSYDGIFRVLPHERRLFQWCIAQSWLLVMTFSAAFLWLFAHFVFSIVQPAQLSEERFKHIHRWQMRNFLVSIIYASSALIATITIWLEWIESDGLSGVCHVGLFTWWKHAVMLTPLMIGSVILLIVGRIRHRRTLVSLRMEALRDMDERVRALEKEVRKVRHTALWSQGRGQAMVTVSDLKNVAIDECVSQGLISKKEAEGRNMDVSCARPPPYEKDLRPDGYIDRKLEEGKRVMAEGKYDFTNGFMAQRERLLEVGAHEFAESLAYRKSAMRQRWQNSIYTSWSYCSILLVFVILLLSLLVHWIFLAHDRQVESKSLKQYIICSIAAGVDRDQLCELDISWADGRQTAVLVVFVLFPAIPFLVLFGAFVSGCRGSGGMNRIREIDDCGWGTCCGLNNAAGDEMELKLMRQSSTRHTVVADDTDDPDDTVDEEVDGEMDTIKEEDDNIDVLQRRRNSAKSFDTQSDPTREKHLHKRIDLDSRLRVYRQQRKEAERELRSKSVEDIMRGRAPTRRAQAIECMQSEGDSDSDVSDPTRRKSAPAPRGRRYGCQPDSMDTIHTSDLESDKNLSLRTVLESLEGFMKTVCQQSLMSSSDSRAWSLTVDLLNKTIGKLGVMRETVQNPDPERLAAILEELGALEIEITSVMPILNKHIWLTRGLHEGVARSLCNALNALSTLSPELSDIRQQHMKSQDRLVASNCEQQRNVVESMGTGRAPQGFSETVNADEPGPSSMMQARNDRKEAARDIQSLSSTQSSNVSGDANKSANNQPHVSVSAVVEPAREELSASGLRPPGEDSPMAPAVNPDRPFAGFQLFAPSPLFSQRQPEQPSREESAHDESSERGDEEEEADYDADALRDDLLRRIREHQPPGREERAHNGSAQRVAEEEADYDADELRDDLLRRIREKRDRYAQVNGENVGEVRDAADNAANHVEAEGVGQDERENDENAQEPLQQAPPQDAPVAGRQVLMPVAQDLPVADRHVPPPAAPDAPVEGRQVLAPVVDRHVPQPAAPDALVGGRQAVMPVEQDLPVADRHIPHPAAPHAPVGGRHVVMPVAQDLPVADRHVPLPAAPDAPVGGRQEPVAVALDGRQGPDQGVQNVNQQVHPEIVRWNQNARLLNVRRQDGPAVPAVVPQNEEQQEPREMVPEQPQLAPLAEPGPGDQPRIHPELVHAPRIPPRGSNMVNAYTESYSASPRGFSTRMTAEELRIRVIRLRQIQSDPMYPQELIYVLALLGDIAIVGAWPLDDGTTVFRSQHARLIIGESPMINIQFEPTDFLNIMRRRAITMVGACGYDFLHKGRHLQPQFYNPPVLPSLGVERFENELTLARIINPRAPLAIRDLLDFFFVQRQGRITYEPQLELVSAFATYMDGFSARQGFPNRFRIEYVPDPSPSGVGPVGLLEHHPGNEEEQAARERRIQRAAVEAEMWRDEDDLGNNQLAAAIRVGDEQMGAEAAERLGLRPPARAGDNVDNGN